MVSTKLKNYRHIKRSVDMSNKVLAGDYEGYKVVKTIGSIYFQNIVDMVPLDKTTVEDYEVITEEHRKSAKSGVVRGAIGASLLGPVGLLAGGISAKKKGTYQLTIQFKSGERSLVEVDEKIYKQLIKNLF